MATSIFERGGEPAVQPAFVLGLDLDGTCADFYGSMRAIVAEWRGVEIDELVEQPDWSLAQWGIQPGEYEEIHRFAVVKRQLFQHMQTLPDAPAALRRLSDEGVRIRIITHRLYIASTHLSAVYQTVTWLDRERIPYWDLCFMRDKAEVGADLYLEDAPQHIDQLRRSGKDVIVMSHAGNAGLQMGSDQRAEDWKHAEMLIRARHQRWLQREWPTAPDSP